MSLLTYQEARESQDLANVLGVCGNGESARSYLNKATRMLMNRGNFWGTVQQIQVCLDSDCVTWPRYVSTVLALVSCNGWIQPFNNWYSFVPVGPAGIAADGFGWRNGACIGNLSMGDTGTSSVFRNVPCGKNYYVRAYLQMRADIGKTITIFGKDSNQQVITTKQSDGSWLPGRKLTLTASAPGYVSTPFTVSDIEYVLKDPTQGPVRLFFYDADNDVLIGCATYGPTETAPQYRVSKISHLHHRCCIGSCDQSVKSVKGLVKLQFVPVVYDTDLVLISNLDALAMMIQSIRERDGMNTKGAADMEVAAIRELNLELRNKFPEEQTTISINPFGTARPRNHGIGRII